MTHDPEHKEKEAATDTEKAATHHKTAAPHDSNPFTTTITAFKKLLEYNANSLVGVIVTTVVSGLIVLATVATIVIAAVAFVLKHTTFFNQLQLPMQFNDLALRLNDANIFSTAFIGFVIVIVLGALLHVLSMRLVLSSSRQETITFGQLFKRSLMRVLPTLGLDLLILLTVFIACLLLGLLAAVLGLITYVLALLAAVGFIYCAIRFMFAPLAVVDNRNPITALRYSWAITKDHSFEAVGVVGASAAIIVAPLSLLNIIGLTVGGPISAAIAFVVIVAALSASSFLYAGMAERYIQLGNINAGLTKATKTDPLNYWSIIIYIVIMIALNTLTPRPVNGPSMPLYLQKLQQQQPNTLTPDNGASSPSTDYTSPGYNLN